MPVLQSGFSKNAESFLTRGTGREHCKLNKLSGLGQVHGADADVALVRP